MAALLRLVNEGIRSVSTARQVSISRLSLLSLNNISRFNGNQTNSNRMIIFERPLSYFSDSDAEKAKPFDAHLFSRYGDYVLDSARFAVTFHNQKQNAQLQFVRVLKADRLRLAEAGSLLYITLEVNDAATGKSSFYRTRVYHWPWEKKRQVDAWERVETPSFDLEDKYEDTDDDESCPTKIKSPFSYEDTLEAGSSSSVGIRGGNDANQRSAKVRRTAESGGFETQQSEASQNAPPTPASQGIESQPNAPPTPAYPPTTLKWKGNQSISSQALQEKSRCYKPKPKAKPKPKSK